jgi:hypothetical protein
MLTAVIVRSEELDKDDVRALLQAIRDCEMSNFAEKAITITVHAPALSQEESTEILTSIEPPYEIGPFIFTKEKEE